MSHSTDSRSSRDRRTSEASAPNRLGAAGEARAAYFLERQGFHVVERNARAARVELDLVVRRGALYVFVEVKTRTGTASGTPEEAVDARKRARITRGAAAWLRERGVRASRVRFDVVACTVDGGEWRIRHWPGAFDAGS